MRPELKQAHQQLEKLKRKLQVFLDEMGDNQQAIQNRLNEIKEAEKTFFEFKANKQEEINKLIEEQRADSLSYRRTIHSIETQEMLIRQLEEIR